MRFILQDQLSAIRSLQLLIKLKAGWLSYMGEEIKSTTHLESLSTSMALEPAFQAICWPWNRPHSSASNTKPVPRLGVKPTHQSPLHSLVTPPAQIFSSLPFLLPSTLSLRAPEAGENQCVWVMVFAGLEFSTNLAAYYWIASSLISRLGQNRSLKLVSNTILPLHFQINQRPVVKVMDHGVVLGGQEPSMKIRSQPFFNTDRKRAGEWEIILQAVPNPYGYLTPPKWVVNHSSILGKESWWMRNHTPSSANSLWRPHISWIGSQWIHWEDRISGKFSLASLQVS